MERARCTFIVHFSMSFSKTRFRGAIPKHTSRRHTVPTSGWSANRKLSHAFFGFDYIASFRCGARPMAISVNFVSTEPC